MKRVLLTVSSIFFICLAGFSQVNKDMKILFRGFVLDATSFAPVSNTQIIINKAFSSVSNPDGTFSFYVNRNDTVIFKSLGYKQSVMFVSDTLRGHEFITGIYMNSDTLSIGEVIIVPKYTNLKSEILNSKTKAPAGLDNARYNVAISAYQGRNSQSVLGDPGNNYAVLSHQQKIHAYERGGIPSDMIVGISPLLLVPAAYLLIKGPPDKPAPFDPPQISDQEIEQVHKKYIETMRQKK